MLLQPTGSFTETLAGVAITLDRTASTFKLTLVDHKRGITLAFDQGPVSALKPLEPETAQLALAAIVKVLDSYLGDMSPQFDAAEAACGTVVARAREEGNAIPVLPPGTELTEEQAAQQNLRARLLCDDLKTVLDAYDELPRPALFAQAETTDVPTAGVITSGVEVPISGTFTGDEAAITNSDEESQDAGGDGAGNETNGVKDQE